MSKMIQSPSEIIEGKRKSTTYVFLAGPIQGAPNWQSDKIIDLGDDVTLINPRRKKYPDPTFDWDKQVNWETIGLRISDIVLVWIPKEIEHIEGRDYAQTTRIELMEQLARGKTVVCGIDPSVNAYRYLKHKYEKYTGKIIHNSLEECVKELKDIIFKRNSITHYFYTSDTHFGSDRALALSKRPFRTVEDMDWTMVERWNKVVAPNDVIYHLGDFGNPEMAKYLNGKIRLLYGNYERRDGGNIWKDKLSKYDIDVIDPKAVNYTPPHRNDIVISHEPLNGKSKISDLKVAGIEKFLLFGHIHGRSRMKKWSEATGGIDVGVDSNNYTPMSEDDVDFYINAIKKFYDEEVWC